MSAAELKQRDLMGKLERLSDDKVREVARLLEILPSNGEVRALLDGLRPQMRRLRPARPLRLQRLWCRVFEDLLTSDATPQGGPRIPRSAIEPCWQLVESRSGGMVAELQSALKTLSTAQPERLRDIAGRLWARSAQILAAAADEGTLIDHLTQFQDTVAAAEEIEAFKSKIPQVPVDPFGEPEANAVEAGIRSLIQKGVRTDGFMIVVAARLRNPGDLLTLQTRVDAGFSTNVVQQLSTLTVAALDDRTRSFERAVVDAPVAQVARDAEQLLKSLARAEEGSDEIARMHAGERTAAVTATVRNALQTRVIGPASSLIEVALPGGDQPATREALIAAEDHAQALGRSRPIAKLAGLEKESVETAQAICRRFEGKIDELLEKSEQDGDKAGDAEKEIYRSIRIVELVEGPVRAQKLLLEARRRLRATAQSGR